MATTATINPTRKFFDSVAATWDESVTVVPSKIDYIIEAAGISEGDRAADVGTARVSCCRFSRLPWATKGI